MASSLPDFIVPKTKASPWANAHCDGGARGNPGPAGYGAVITDDAGTVIAELSEFVGHKTNNFAEYSGLLGVLQWALDNGYKRLRVTSDSELMVKQILGKYKVNSPDLKPLWEEAKWRISKLDNFTIMHALRHKNRAADKLANAAMDRGMKDPNLAVDFSASLPKPLTLPLAKPTAEQAKATPEPEKTAEEAPKPVEVAAPIPVEAAAPVPVAEPIPVAAPEPVAAPPVPVAKPVPVAEPVPVATPAPVASAPPPPVEAPKKVAKAAPVVSEPPPAAEPSAKSEEILEPVAEPAAKPRSTRQSGVHRALATDHQAKESKAPENKDPERKARVIRGVSKDGVIHLIGGERLSNGTFVSITVDLD